MLKNEYMMIYLNLIQIYRIDKDCCYKALDELKHAVANCDRAISDGALDKLANSLDGLTETVEIALNRFKKVSVLVDKHLDEAESNHKEQDSHE